MFKAFRLSAITSINGGEFNNIFLKPEVWDDAVILLTR